MAPGHMPPIVAGRDLRKSWGGTLVLEHADFVLQEGEKAAHVGANGAASVIGPMESGNNRFRRAGRRS